MHQPASGPAFPAHPDQVTPEWITDQLRAHGAIGGDHVVSGFTTSIIGEGAGMLGVIGRLKLDYAGEPGPVRSVIAKCATPVVANRAVAVGFKVYEREVGFFRDLAGPIGSCVPRCFAAEIDTDTADFILLLEDIDEHELGDQIIGATLEQAEQAIDALAAIHAPWWDGRNRTELDWVFRVEGEVNLGGFQAGFAAGWEPFLAAFGDRVDPSLIAGKDRFEAAIPALHRRMGSGHQSLVHGDYRLDNLMFATHGAHEPVVVIDWQGMLVSNGTQDLAYLLSQNLPTDLRRTHERDLVARYQQRLVDHGITGYSVDEVWDDYLMSCLYAWEYAVVIGGTLDPSNDRGRAFMAALTQRSSATLVDHDLLNRLP
jgi:hypothetical protein